ncbi:LPXTG-motif cell wall anchor domain-containing protein [Pelagirhabdus alkalitolerans]|uniref:LPXTG-motif cell wall anchor domain-containing protein n=1 Tax=Pelagirhabdus alkalitolerans TaxID=1612202 RepID=A0A1G6LH59_9BACI|nr:family 10 glycosylhydrolase [Pelagirhabdus alkalitolerans]SDC42095.1 LPXTG-motif cell wall anchor domain-containing protein [Pelagirhabdus alkalitolerans]
MKNQMKNFFTLLLVSTLLISGIALYQPHASHAEENDEEILVKHDDETIEIELVDPELTSEGQADRPADTLTLFTRNFGESTKTNEWGVEVAVSDGIVKKVSDPHSGNTGIPSDGYVISVIDSDGQEYRDQLRSQFSEGDEVRLEGIDLPELDDDEESEEEPEEVSEIGSVSNQDGDRLTVNQMNVDRTEDTEVVLYTAQFGSMTGTNEWGREMIVDLNDDDELEVKSFRDIGEGDQSGSEIPRWGFVLSALDPYRDYLEEDEIFSVGDIITLEDINLIELDNEESFEYVTINPTPETNPDGVEDEEAGEYFPGLRGGEQLLIYTSDWDSETTGTNAYGYEIVVEGDLSNGTIVATGGNDSHIPEDGYVLSGHGDAASFLIGNGSVGSQVIVDEDTSTVTLKTTPESLISNVSSTLASAQERYDLASDQLLDVDFTSIKEALEKAEDQFDKANALAEMLSEGEGAHDDQIEFLTLLDDIEENANTAFYRTFESHRVEGRSIWHRPTEENLEEVKANLDELAKSHFNLVFIETWNDGYSITNSSNDLIGMQPRIEGNTYGEYDDLLEAYVEEGKKRGIEVHAWVQNYRVGHKGNDPSSPIIDQKPEWVLEHYDESIYTPHENDYVFMDPAIPDVQEFLMDYYKELVEDYDIQGLQLDYIRYPVGHYRSDSGYGDYSANAFKEEYDLDKDEDLRDLLDRDEDPELVETWEDWKTGHITDFVEYTFDELKAIDDALILSTAIFEDIQDSIGTKNQDWPTWVQEGWVDLTTPMAYYRDADTVADSVHSMVDLVDGKALNYAGIAPTYMGLQDRENAKQTYAARLGEAQGSAIFASQNVLGLDNVQDVLKESTYRESAVLPHADLDEVIHVGLDELFDRIERIYYENEKITSDHVSYIENYFAELKEKPTDTASDLDVIESQLNELKAEADQLFESPADQRFEESLSYLQHIIGVRTLRMDLISDEDVEDEKAEKQIEENTVTVNDHYIEESISANQFEVLLDASSGVNQLELSEDQIEKLKEHQLDIVIEYEGVNLSVPSKNLEGLSVMTIESDAESSQSLVDHAMSEVYTLHVMTNDQTLSTFDPPVQLSLQVNNSFEEADDLSIYYYNDEISEWEDVGGIYEEGYVSTTLDHFSTFAVFSDDVFASDDSSESDDDDATESVDSDEEDEGDEEKSDPSDSYNDEETSDEDTEDEETLPDTATFTYNYLLIAGILIILGAFILFYQRYKKES